MNLTLKPYNITTLKLKNEKNNSRKLENEPECPGRIGAGPADHRVL